MTLDNFQTLIIEQIVKESTKPTNVDAVKIDWNCSVHNCIHILSLTYKFFHKISALTSRVTKLGTLLVWSNSYTQAADYLKTIYGGFESLLNTRSKYETNLGNFNLKNCKH